MAKILKILAKMIGGTLEWVLILIIGFAFAIRTSAFQTYLAELATNYLSNELETELHIGKVDIYFFDKLSLDDVFVRDQNGDTLASLQSIDVVLQSLNLNKNKIVLSRVALNEGRIGINRDSIKGDYNYEFIRDYFDSGPSRKKKKPTDLTIKALDLEKIDITYDDYRKSYSEYGMDFDHLVLKDVELHANTFATDGNTFSFYLEKLKAHEKCGFDLRRLKAQCEIGDKGILLKQVRINTSRSKIYAHKFNLRMSGLDDINSFVDSVQFDAEIDSSAVSMRDVSYFAPALKGMRQKVYLRAELSNKVKNLKIREVDLRTGKRTIIRGDFNLPDFNEIESSFLSEKLTYAFVDLEDVKSFRLPDNATQQFLSFDPMIERLGYFEAKKLDVIGYPSQFVLSSHFIGTDLGTVHLDNGLLFTALDEGGYTFERSASGTYDVAVDSFNLGKFLDNSLLGDVRGTLFLGGVVGQKDIIRLHKLDGELRRFTFNDYTYSAISVKNGSYEDKVFSAKIDIEDPHLNLHYDGRIDMSNGQKFDFTVNIAKADLGKLNFTSNLSTKLVTNFEIELTGNDISNYEGEISLKKLAYNEDSNVVNVPELRFVLDRQITKDNITITSDVANLTLSGKIDPFTIAQSINNLLSKPFSAYFQFDPFPRKLKDDDHFDLNLTVKDADQLLNIFAPKLKVAAGTSLIVHYDARNQEQSISLVTGTGGVIMYDSIIAKDLNLEQSLINGKMLTNLSMNRFALSDSLFVNNLDLAVNGEDNNFTSTLKWNESEMDPAKFAWITTLGENNRLAIKLKPSFFSVKHQLWEIQNSARLKYEENRLEIDHLVIEREAQFIAVNGVLSNNKEDKVLLNLRDIHLDEFSTFINEETDIAGTLNGDVNISTPFTSFNADGDLSVQGLTIEKEPIGDVIVSGIWDKIESRLTLNGSLRYALLQEDAFDFYGYYYPYREQNSLDLNLDFKNLDVQFANAFMDPEILTDIHGKLKGKIDITGSIDAPMVDGKLKLQHGNAKVGMLGVSYKMAGDILFDGGSSGFYINNMPVVDEEGNKAFLTASISHQQFSNWNTDILINMEDDFSRRDGRGVPMPVDRFLVMNTTYREGDVYYGRAYVTGTANIFLTEQEVAINVNVKTKRDTKVDIPMYGNSELEEGKFIVVRDPYDTSKANIKPKIDLTGLSLNLNLEMTPDAEVKLIFNEKTNDMIVAHGQGPLTISLDNLNNLTMKGSYEIAGKENNYYNFVLGPIKQQFKIKEGGSIRWSGDATNAELNLEAYNPVRANINEIAPDLASDNASNGNKEVHCLLKISQTLSEPKIVLDIDAPSATESEKTILSGIKSPEEELQKQFFSLLLFRKFVPLAGHTTGGTGGLTDVLEQQINGILNGLSDDVNLNLDIAGDGVTGSQSYKLGVSRQFGRVLLKGSFGVANSEVAGGSQSNLIGDMSLEYLINQDGTFRVNLFNESNDNSVIQDKTQGLFTQGVGLSYQEEFNSGKDFKMVQIFLDLFRKEKRIKIKKNRREVSVEEPLVAPKPVENQEKKQEEPAKSPAIQTTDALLIVREDE